MIPTSPNSCSGDSDKDGLGARMKAQYEDRARYMLPRRTWAVVRCDGKAFHTFTRGCDKPFDAFFHSAMVAAATALCEEAQGAKMGYAQSDEISVVLTDFDNIGTEAWFDGNVQKIASVAASVVTMAFNEAYRHHGETTRAVFDARVFTIPDPVEVENYLIWRQKDAIRNSVSGLAQAHFSSKQLHGLKRSEMLNQLLGIGVDWNASPIHVQRGTVIHRAERGWIADYESPVFTDDREYMRRSLAINDAVCGVRT